jgi:hypothetical protein
MRLGRILLLVIILGMTAACGGGGGGSAIPIVISPKKPATLVSISVTPANPSVSVGASEQFTATGSFSDSSTKNLTSSVTWTSSNESVASINASGLMSSAGTGTTLISAISGSITGSMSLKVTSGGAVSGPNVMPVTVNGSLCNPATSSNYPNKPCVSVTLCTAGTSTCQTIDDILLDTGSYGLRIFHQVVTVPLSQVTVSAGSLAECVQYGDGSTQWGAVKLADVVLGGENAVSVPIQVIDQAFGTPPSVCNGPLADTGPAAGAGFNGILGVGLFAHDCGDGCVSNSDNGYYYSCSGSSCIATSASLTSQVQNPVSLLATDNNGVILSLPSIAPTGAGSVDGSMILGIGTQSNNAPWSVTMYPVNPQSPTFLTVFNGKTYTYAFIDSGSNGLFFPSTMTTCSSGMATGWFCPLSAQNLSATNKGYAGLPSGVVGFSIANANALFTSGNGVFNDLGADTSPYAFFDWGLPFFLGRDIYVGIDGMTSPLGTGPYWAY